MSRRMPPPCNAPRFPEDVEYILFRDPDGLCLAALLRGVWVADLYLRDPPSERQLVRAARYLLEEIAYACDLSLPPTFGV